MSRLTNSIRNLKFALIGQMLGIIINIISRKVFVMFLSVEYLGLNGLFSNILSMLSLAELGVGAAIIYSLYRPIAENKIDEIKSLMLLYKRVYYIIGIFIFIAGCMLAPFLHLFIKEMPNISNIKLIYIIFVANSAISYFFTYKRSLIIANQMHYYIILYHYGLLLLLNIAQIIVLYLTRNFILYLLLQTINTLLENYLLSKKADRLYPYIKDNSNIMPLTYEIKNEIKRNVTAMFFHRVGGIVVFATDSILISKIVGLMEVGLYSNYMLIRQAVNAITGQIFQASAASFGNLNVEGSDSYKLKIFNVMNFIGAWVFGFCSICLFNLINPFIKLWLGASYLFPIDTVFWIISAFYITGMRQACLTARDSMGLFWYDRYKPIFEISINLLVSIILGRKFGVSGIIAGTVISTIATSFWWEPFIVYKYGFHFSVRGFFYNYLFFTVITFIAGVISTMLCNIATFEYSIMLQFIIKFCICLFIPNIIFCLSYLHLYEFRYVREILKQQVHDLFKDNKKGR